MKRAIQLMILLAGVAAAQIPQIAPGSWKFTINNGTNAPVWSATLQLFSQFQGTSVTGTFQTGSGGTFPGFTSQVSSGTGAFGKIFISWDPTNRDIPGLLGCIANANLIPFCYSGIVSPDGNSMLGDWSSSPSGNGDHGTWTATFIPAGAPTTPVAPSTSTVAACTASVQSMGPGSLVLTGLICSITPATPTGGLIQFAGDTNLSTVTGAYQQPPAPIQ